MTEGRMSDASASRLYPDRKRGRGPSPPEARRILGTLQDNFVPQHVSASEMPLRSAGLRD
jgi:hypothetical protein